MRQFHYFASSVANWNVADTMGEVIKRQTRADKQMMGSHFSKITFDIYRVPLPLDAHYKINHYQPVVEGIELLESIVMERKGKRIITTHVIPELLD